MSRQEVQVNKFITGMVSAPSLSDIPEDASVMEQDVDPFDELGRLKGRKDDETHISSVYGTSFAFVDTPDDERDLIYFNPSSTSLRVVSDFYGTPVDSSIGTITASITTPSFSHTNQEIHVGVGSTELDYPRWVGYIPHKQFGVELTTLDEYDARLLKPASISNMHKIVIDDSFLYGIEWGGKRIHKFDYANDIYIGSSEVEFGELRALGLARDSGDAYDRYSTGDNSYLWVIDSDHESQNALLKVNRLDFEIEQTNIITTALISNYDFSDLLETGDGGSSPYYMWLTIYPTDGIFSTSNGNQIFNVAESGNYDAAGDFGIVARGPYLGGDVPAGVRGEWLKGTPISTTADMEYGLGRNPLYKPNISANYVGYTAFFINAVPTTRAYLNTDGSGVGDTLDGLYNVLAKYDVTNDNITSWNGSTGGTFVRKIQDAGLDEDYTGASDVDFITSVIELKDGSNYEVVFSTKSTGGPPTGSRLYAISRVEALSTATWGDLATMQTDKTLTMSGIDSIILCSRDTSSPWEMYGAPSYGVGRISRTKRVYDDSWESPTSIVPADVTITAASRGTGGLSGAEHWYGVSWLYDGYQEGPLATQLIQSDGDNYQDITVDVYNPPRRATHVNIYRGDNSVGSTTSPNSFYRLVKSLRLDANFKVQTETTWGTYHTRTIVDNDNRGATYDALVGISETLDYFTPNYELAASVNGSNYITRIFHPKIDDGTRYLMKSKAGKFDQYDWSNDYMILPETATAIAGFNGRLYVWSANNLYRINPDGLYIEDVYEGMGCLSQGAVVVTDYGMAFANANNMYLHDGTRPNTIGDAVRTMQSSYALGWDDMTHTSGVYVWFDSIHNAFYFWTQKSTQGYAFIFTLRAQRWDLWKVDDISGGFTGDEGQVYVCDKTNLVSVATSSTRENFLWISKYLDNGRPLTDKKFRRLRMAYRGTAPAISFKVNEATVGVTSNTDHTIANQLAVYDITTNQNGQHGYWFLTGNVDGTSVVDAISFLYSERPPR